MSNYLHIYTSTVPVIPIPRWFWSTSLTLSSVSFDWSVISGFLLSPLQTPAFAIFNVAAGILLMMCGT